MKIKMITSVASIISNKTYNYGDTFIVDKNIDKELAMSFINCNYANIIENDIPNNVNNQEELIIEQVKEVEQIDIQPTEKLKRGRKKKVDNNED